MIRSGVPGTQSRVRAGGSRFRSGDAQHSISERDAVSGENTAPGRRSLREARTTSRQTAAETLLRPGLESLFGAGLRPPEAALCDGGS